MQQYEEESDMNENVRTLSMNEKIQNIIIMISMFHHFYLFGIPFNTLSSAAAGKGNGCRGSV